MRNSGLQMSYKIGAFKISAKFPENTCVGFTF